MPAAIPKYMLDPSRYMYNSDTKRHMLKTGAAFRKLYKEYPARFVESSSMFPQPIQPPISLPLPPLPVIPAPVPHIGAPLPDPTPPPPSKEELEAEALRHKVKHVIQSELKANPAPYAGKNAAELSALFRQMLLERLAPAHSINNKQTPVRKSARAPSPFNFKLAKLPEPPSDEEDFDDDNYEEEFEDDA